MKTSMSPFETLPTELIIAIATQLDACSLLDFNSTCKVFREVVSRTLCLRYALALAARGLSDGPPSPVSMTSRLELVEKYEKAWRSLSWSEHLTLDVPHPHEAPYVFGGMLVQPTRDNDAQGLARSFVVQTIPSQLRGVPGQQWQVDFDFFVESFIIDATQDLLAVVAKHDPQNVLVCALSTGQPHPLSANGGVLRLERPRSPSSGNSKHEVCGDLLGMMTWSSDALDDRLLIWNWKTGVLHVNTRIQVGDVCEAVFSFLDEHHFVVPSVLSKSSSEIVLNVYRLCHHRRHHHHDPSGPGPQPQQQQPQETPPIVRRYVLSVADALHKIRSLRFFPDVTARGGASPGHFYADASRRAFGIQFEATTLETGRDTVQELLVPLRALMAPEPSSSEPPYRRASVRYEKYLGRRLAYASRVVGEERAGCGGGGGGGVPVEKLPPALRGGGVGRLRFAVCFGALLVFEHAVEHPGQLMKLHILAF